MNIAWGSGISRSRIAGLLPVFPEGVHREAQIQVKFTVRPDGSLFGMTLVQKGEPSFEQASLSAMRTWKFNALPVTSEQKDQKAVATFYFKLK